VEVIPDEPRAPRLSSMQRPDGSLVSKPLEDLFPFLDREEFLANMIVAPVEE
jgi:acetolactate synthase-1/2/3 large subunit